MTAKFSFHFGHVARAAIYDGEVTTVQLARSPTSFLQMDEELPAYDSHINGGATTYISTSHAAEATTAEGVEGDGYQEAQHSLSVLFEKYSYLPGDLESSLESLGLTLSKLLSMNDETILLFANSMDKSSTADLVLLTQALKHYKESLNPDASAPLEDNNIDQSASNDTFNNNNINTTHNTSTAPAMKTHIASVSVSHEHSPELEVVELQTAGSPSTSGAGTSNNITVGSGQTKTTSSEFIQTNANGTLVFAKDGHVFSIERPKVKAKKCANTQLYAVFWVAIFAGIISLCVCLGLGVLDSGEDESTLYCDGTCSMFCVGCSDSSDYEGDICGYTSSYSKLYCEEEKNTSSTPTQWEWFGYGWLLIESLVVLFNTWFFMAMEDPTGFVAAFSIAILIAVVLPFAVIMAGCGGPGGAAGGCSPMEMARDCDRDLRNDNVCV